MQTATTIQQAASFSAVAAKRSTGTGLLTRLLDAYDRQRQRRMLLQLDDRMLRDFAVSRLAAIDEARKPFWR